MQLSSVSRKAVIAAPKRASDSSFLTHAPILLADLPRLEGRLDGASRLFRAPVRMIAKLAAARLTWHERANGDAFAGEAARELCGRLLPPPPVFSPSVNIAPTMLAVEVDGYAAKMLADVTATISIDAASLGAWWDAHPGESFE
ncbi:MAG: hypothetical protein U5J99_07520 [Parvularculaceae bacterium]|nr:hypothetical protein [Parvularculaceae bacterium]